MLRNLKELFAVYCEQTQKVSKELAGQILGTEEVGKLVDQICMNLPLDYVNRQKLLEAVELSERYDTLCVMIANEIQIQEIRSEIQGKSKSGSIRTSVIIFCASSLKSSARNSARTIPGPRLKIIRSSLRSSKPPKR